MDPVKHPRPTRAEIDLDALADNFRVMKDLVGPAVKIMAVVKADAYGHGAAKCAERLEDEGVDWFGVAIPEEGSALRQVGDLGERCVVVIVLPRVRDVLSGRT